MPTRAGIRALLVLREDASRRFGGDVVQARQTAAHLRDCGVDATLIESTQPDARGYDLAHVFGIFEPDVACAQFDALCAYNIPIVLSPIWWDLRENWFRARAIERALHSPIFRSARLRRLQRRPIASFMRGRPAARFAERIAAQRRLMERAAALLPNSTAEATLYREVLGVDHPAVSVVPNAFVAPPPAPQASARRGILCAARVETRKNQAMLLYALRGLDVPITLLGEEYDPDYSALCRRFAGSNVRFVSQVAHGDVFTYMRQAAVHVLPSWLETPGIASLEAAACGARVIVGDRGSEREYFGQDASYVVPDDPQALRAVVEAALALPARVADDTLAQRIGGFTWARAAALTAAAYARVLTIAGRAATG